jgi:hypothetical protein
MGDRPLRLYTGAINVPAFREYKREFKKRAAAYNNKMRSRRLNVNAAIELANEARLAANSAIALAQEDPAKHREQIVKMAREIKDKANRATTALKEQLTAFGENTNYNTETMHEIGGAISAGLHVAQTAIHIADRALGLAGKGGAGAGSHEGGRRRTRRNKPKGVHKPKRKHTRRA